MGKNNRKRRRVKTNKKRAKRKQSLEKKIVNTSVNIAPSIFQIPDLMDGKSQDERVEIFESIAKLNIEKLESITSDLSNLFCRSNPFILIAHIINYGLMVHVDDNTGVTTRDSEQKVYQWQIEVLQAVLLSIEPSELGKAYPAPTDISELIELVDNLGTHMSIVDINPNIDFSDKKALSVFEVVNHIKANTRTVRNWGYHHQVLKISKELYTPLDSFFIKEYGLSSQKVIGIFDYMMEEVERKAQYRFKKLRALFAAGDKSAMLEHFFKTEDISSDQQDEFRDGYDVTAISKKSLFSFLVSYTDQNIDEIFYFSSQELSAALELDMRFVTRILDRFSMQVGDLNIGSLPEFQLNNDVWSRPLVNLGEGTYYCFAPQIVFSFVFTNMNSMIPAKLETKLSRVRSSYAESKVKQIVLSRFPESTISTNISWRVGDQTYETDMVVGVDSHLILIEVKSAKISPPGRRGAESRMQRHLNEVYIAPNIQSRRLEVHLNELIENPSLQSELRDNLPQDLNKIKQVLRLSVSLEDFGAIQSNINRLKGTGWLPDDFVACPTMNLADFENLFIILESPIQIIHYLKKRQRFEVTHKYHGDELDLVGLYIDTLFCLPDVASDGDIYITGSSYELDCYFNSIDAGIKTRKPRPKLDPLFESLIAQLEERSMPRWTEFGVLLHECSPDDQLKLSRGLKRLFKSVRQFSAREGHENMVIMKPDKANNIAIAFFVYDDVSGHRKKEFVQDIAAMALEEKHIDYCLVVGFHTRNIKRYDLIALFNDQRLGE